MAVMRVEKTSNFTIMANHHLKDNRLSLKAKGLLSVMLSLPAEWDFTLKGLSQISKEGISAIRAAIAELEEGGYVKRTRIRNAAGQLIDTDYTIYEFPQNNNNDNKKTACISEASSIPTDYASVALTSDSLITEKPMSEKPTSDNPTLEKPTSENRTQLNTKDINTNTLNPYQSIIHPSIPDIGEQISVHDLEQKIKDQIDYWDLIERNDKEEIENILSIMVEVMSAQCSHFTISGKKYPSDLVRQRFEQINASIVEYILECLHKCGSNIRSIKQYLITALFNAPATCESYYGAAVRRDLEYMRR